MVWGKLSSSEYRGLEVPSDTTMRTLLADLRARYPDGVPGFKSPEAALKAIGYVSFRRGGKLPAKLEDAPVGDDNAWDNIVFECPSSSAFASAPGGALAGPSGVASASSSGATDSLPGGASGSCSDRANDKAKGVSQAN